MKRILIILVIIVLSAICIICGTKGYSYFSPAKERNIYQTAQHHDDTIRIAYIGDSWAFMHREHECHISDIIEDIIHCPVKVHSYGICGTTSKEFYENMFNNADLKHFLQKRRYEYCCISLGINDTYKKMSAAYYQQSMEYILKFFLTNQVHPIILEIPDYDIIKSFERQNNSRKLLRRLSMFINKTPLNCKQLFRNALDELISKKMYTKDVSIIRYMSWNSYGTKDLNTLYLSDGIHLNTTGYAKLDSCIIKTCIELKKSAAITKN